LQKNGFPHPLQRANLLALPLLGGLIFNGHSEAFLFRIDSLLFPAVLAGDVFVRTADYGYLLPASPVPAPQRLQFTKQTLRP
jgi:hypothetical protein